MTLSDLAALGSFVSGVAVLASIVLLYFQLRQLNQQIRQAEKNQQAAIRQGRATQVMDLVLTGVDSSVADALNRVGSGDDNVSETALRQFHQYVRAGFFGWEDGYYQHLDGLLPETAFRSLKNNIRSRLGGIGYRTQWRVQRHTFGSEYVAWMDKFVAEMPIDEPRDSLAVWRSALSKERSGASY